MAIAPLSAGPDGGSRQTAPTWRRWLQRETRDGRWLPEIDGLRFLAIAGVLLFHMVGEVGGRGGFQFTVPASQQMLFRTLGNGDRGVRLFFMISGLVLALPFARATLAGGRPVSLRKYFLRRLTRLEPPYLLALALSAAMVGLWDHQVPQQVVHHLAASMIYSHVLFYVGPNPWIPVTWSLEVEVQFYLLAPLLMKVYYGAPRWVRRVAVVALIVPIGLLQVRYIWLSQRLGRTLLMYLQYFLAGLLLADLYVTESEHMYRGWLWDVAAVLGFVYAVFSIEESREAHVALPLVFFAFIMAAFYGRAWRWLVSLRPLAIVGGMCYSIYLLHLQLIAALFKVTHHLLLPSAGFLLNYGVQLIVTLLPVLALCVIYFALIERPCMDPDWPSHLVRWLGGRRRHPVLDAEAKALDSGGIS